MTDNRRGEILADYMRRLDSGEAVDVESLCAQYPEYAEELRSYVRGAAVVQDLLRRGDTSQPGAHQGTVKDQKEKSHDSLPTGAVFGRYRIQKQLGEGAMGEVYLARDLQLDRPVALKTPKLQFKENDEFASRFRWEAQAAAKLHHPGICPVFDFGDVAGRPYITMAYIKGQPLSEYVGNKQLSHEWILKIIREVAAALQHAHQMGVVHRDLKAGNVMVNEDGHPVVTDFGLAQNLDQSDASRMTHQGALLGTPGYMSPEQVEGDLEKIGPATDIYALGVILYELLAGDLPFRGAIHAILGQIIAAKPRNPQLLNPNAESKLCDFCLQMLAKAIEDRPASMEQVVHQLDKWIAKPTAEQVAAETKKQKLLKLLEAKKLKTAGLVKRGQFAQAIELLEKIGAVTNADAVGYATWAREELKRVRILPQKVRDGIPALVETARELISKHDYGQAAELLQEIPREMRSPEVERLLDQSIELQDEVELLLEDLKECVKQRQFDGIEGNVKQLLKLKPKNRFARRLWEALQGYLEVPVHRRHYKTDENGNLLPLRPARSRNAIAAFTILGLLILAGGLYGVTLLFRSGDTEVTVKIDDTLLASGDVTLRFNGEDHVISGPEFRLKIGPGEYGYELRQGDRIIVNPKQFRVVSDGVNVLEVTSREIASETTKDSVAASSRDQPFRSEGYVIDVDYGRDQTSHVPPLRRSGQSRGLNTESLFWEFSGTERKGGPLIYDYEEDLDAYECEMIVRLNNIQVWWTLPRVGNDRESRHLKMLIAPAGYTELQTVNANWIDGEWKRNSDETNTYPIDEQVSDESGTWMVLRVIRFGRKYQFFQDGVLIQEADDDNTLGESECVPLNHVKLWLLPEKNDKTARFEIQSLKLKSLDESDSYRLAEHWMHLDSAAPRPGIVPFSGEQASRLQQEWASHLGVPVEFTDQFGMTFRLIPPGEFTMGTSQDEIQARMQKLGDDHDWKASLLSEAPQHRVAITKPFYLATHEVTQNQFESVMSTNPSMFVSENVEDLVDKSTLNFPVDSVLWRGTQLFVKRLHMRLGVSLEEAENPYYRLPTEAEWEFACRAGTATDYWAGSDSKSLVKKENVGNAFGTILDVGSLAANPFGLYDMSGNVHEFVQDRWTERYDVADDGAVAVDPVGASDPGLTKRVARGGDYWWSDHHSRSAYRIGLEEKERPKFTVGFRLAGDIELYRFAVESKLGEPSVTDFAEIHGASRTELEDWFKSIRGRLVPLRINLRWGTDEHLFDAVAVDDNDQGPWAVNFWENDPGAGRDFNRMKNTHDIFWKLLFAEPGKKPWECPGLKIWRQTPNESGTWNIGTKDLLPHVNGSRIRGWIPSSLAYTESGGSRNSAFVHHSWQGAGHQSYVGLTIDELNEQVTESRIRGWRIHFFQMQVGTAEPRISCVFRENFADLKWDVSTGLTERQFESELRIRRTNGMYPSSIGSYQSGGVTKYLVAWEQFHK